ncbi:MarR family winged helix-turn-helix transcriptional regulator [Nocardioides mesophilus]|uniref:Winged helix-turn-helix transcriptional regulator n=1 Tax=Nocardioides mesophilus TaxID=433659 RepID=A0A7G9R7B1_9ACTN|nr:MarR family winged helix-turn-helix transcriptional regulator [Nocardioides mesophilus]QNN51486.1 winged helix-turn-helix transcriptional regulator [Nocardioides mesophilus]
MDEVPWVRLLSMAVTVALESLHEQLAEAGHPTLRPAHGYALNAILNGHDTASAIAPVLGMTKQGAAKLLQALVDEGYVDAGPAAGDARRRPYVLTERGRSAIEASVRIQAELEAQWADVVGQRQLRTARLALEKAVRAGAEGELPPVRPSW